jgi:hypothetical protein
MYVAEIIEDPSGRRPVDHVVSSDTFFFSKLDDPSGVELVASGIPAAQRVRRGRSIPHVVRPLSFRNDNTDECCNPSGNLAPSLSLI